ncbi:MAG: hypothetical protein GXO00_03010 [Candidatus Diapherotrites archaeon]|nr:hypothetical protein [Candidatus Diapherotrites archaeon]
MKLAYPAPTLSIGLDTLSKVVADVLRKKHWHRFKEGTVKLVYIPVYVFTYEVFLEENGVVVMEQTGKVAVNGETGELLEHVPYVLDEMPLELTTEPKHGYQMEVRDFTLSKEEAKELAQIKLASLLKLPRSAIKVVGGNKLLWPVWKVWVEVREGTYRLDVDGVTGMVFGAEKVPERELGWYEITQQVLTELRSPRGWIKYLNKLAELLRVPPWVVYTAVFGLILYLLYIIFVR